MEDAWLSQIYDKLKRKYVLHKKHPLLETSS